MLFAACANSGNPPAQPPQPMMVILSATDGKIIANLPLAGGSDGAVFNHERNAPAGVGSLWVHRSQSLVSVPSAFTSTSCFLPSLLV